MTGPNPSPQSGWSYQAPPPTAYPVAQGYQAAPNPARKLGWRILNSTWLLIPTFGFGCLSGVPLVVLGLVARRRAWWISGIVYCVSAWAAFLVFSLGAENRNDDGVRVYTASEDVSMLVLMACWLACIVHSALVNGSWLRWRANRVPWYHQPVTAGGTLAPPPALAAPRTGMPVGVLPAGMVPPPHAYYDSAPPVTPVPAGTPVGSASAGSSYVPRTTASQPIDLNSATLDQLAALPGLNRRSAQRIIQARDERGGFFSVNDLVALEELDPHEFARLRTMLTCTPPRRPGAPAGGATGRIVDV